MKTLALFLSFCLLLPPPALALRSGVEGTTQAGVEAELRPAGFPVVEVLRPDRLASFRLKTALWAFDGTLWTGYPSKEADRYFAQRLGLNTRNPAVMKSFHDFIQSASGLSWSEVKGRLQARGWALAEEIAGEGLLADVRNYADEIIGREGKTNPAEYLVPGSRELLSASREAGVRHVIVTGASAQSRAKYAMQLGIRLFFDEIHGEGKKEEVVAHELEEGEAGRDGIALIGDGLKDMEIARRAGILAVAYAATPEAREAFLALPEKFRPDVILNRNYQETDWILSVLGVPDPGRKARLREYERMFLEDLKSPVILPKEYTVYITELVQRKSPPGKDRAHHVGAMVSLSPYEPPVGFLPFANIFKDEKGSAPWITEKIELLRRLKEEQHPIEVAVDRKGISYKPGRHLDFVFRLNEPWSRARVLQFRHSTDRLTEPMFLNALAHGIPIPVAVREGISQSNLEGLEAEILDMIAQLLRQTQFFSGSPGAGPFKVQMKERKGHVVPQLLLLENGTQAFSPLEQPIALDRIIAKALWEFSEMAKASGKTYEGEIILRVEQMAQFLVLEFMNNGPGVPPGDLGQFFFSLMGSKPSEWLDTHGSEMLRRHRGWMEIDTRSAEKEGAYRILFNPVSPDVELRELQPGARQGRGTTLRLVFNLAAAPRGYFTAGAEEMTPEKVREWAVQLEQRLRGELDKIDRLLTDFPGDSGLDWVGVMRKRLLEIGVVAEPLKRFARELKQSSAIHERTAGYELEEPLNRIFVAASGFPSQMAIVEDEEEDDEAGTIESWLAMAMDVIRGNMRQMKRVLDELKNLEEIRLTAYHDVTLLALGSSREIRPEWIPINKLQKLSLLWLPQEISPAAAEAGADGVALIPLAAQPDRVLNLRPLVYGSLQHRADVERYLEGANQLLKEYGIRFGPMEAYDPGLVNSFGFVLFEEAPPFPEQLPALAAEYLSASNPGHLHPVFVAAKTLYPNLPWKFLKGIQVKALMIVEDEATGARYLAVLA